MSQLAIDKISTSAKKYNFEVIEKTTDKIIIKIKPHWHLIFENLKNDTLIHFENGGDWHAHGEMFLDSETKTLTAVPEAILQKLATGKLKLIEEKNDSDQTQKYFTTN